jgi:hypothetical protein
VNSWALLGLVLAWIASLFAVGIWQNGAGHVAERSAWQTKENIELATANAKIIALNQAARDKEHKTAEELNLIATQFEKDKSNELKKRDEVIASLRAGVVRLRDPAAASIQTAGNSSGATATATGCRDG